MGSLPIIRGKGPTRIEISRIYGKRRHRMQKQDPPCFPLRVSLLLLALGVFRHHARDKQFFPFFPWYTLLNGQKIIRSKYFVAYSRIYLVTQFLAWLWKCIFYEIGWLAGWLAVPPPLSLFCTLRTLRTLLYFVCIWKSYLAQG